MKARLASSPSVDQPGELGAAGDLAGGAAASRPAAGPGRRAGGGRRGRPRSAGPGRPRWRRRAAASGRSRRGTAGPGRGCRPPGRTRRRGWCRCQRLSSGAGLGSGGRSGEAAGTIDPFPRAAHGWPTHEGETIERPADFPHAPMGYAAPHGGPASSGVGDLEDLRPDDEDPVRRARPGSAAVLDAGLLELPAGLPGWARQRLAALQTSAAPTWTWPGWPRATWTRSPSWPSSPPARSPATACGGSGPRTRRSTGSRAEPDGSGRRVAAVRHQAVVQRRRVPDRALVTAEAPRRLPALRRRPAGPASGVPCPGPGRPRRCAAATAARSSSDRPPADPGG